MINRSEIKAKARAPIKGNIRILFVCQLVIVLISSLADNPNMTARKARRKSK